MSLMKCKKCNNEISNKVNFCPKCGVEINKKHNCITWLVVFLIPIVIGILFSLFYSFFHVDSSVIMNHSAKYTKKSVVPEYEIICNELTEQPFKTMVIMTLAMTGKVTKTNVKLVLEKVFEDIETVSSYKYHSKPTLTAIYIYTTPKLAKNKEGIAIATLHKNGLNKLPIIIINEEMINAYNEKLSTKYGYTEAERKGIFKQLIAAEDKARTEAEKKFPCNHLLGEKLIEVSSKQSDTFEMLKQEYENIIETKYGLSSDQNMEISVEGIKKNWSMPPFRNK